MKDDTNTGAAAVGAPVERGVSQRFVVCIGAREVPLKPADYRLLRRIEDRGGLDDKHVRGPDWSRMRRLRRAGFVGADERAWRWRLLPLGADALAANSRLANVRAKPGATVLRCDSA